MGDMNNLTVVALKYALHAQPRTGIQSKAHHLYLETGFTLD